MGSRFGNEYNTHLDCFNTLVDELLLEYDARRIADNKDRLILVIFEYSAELSYMARFALRYFSAWPDVMEFSREVVPGWNVPSLKKTPIPLEYRLRDIIQDRKSEGAAHNAGNNVTSIFTGVLAHYIKPSGTAKFSEDAFTPEIY
ncbi:hypothetical protein F4808DRAFT_461605 [Astrocystis sublimbata]|nr:hypothetical protein F4808DRAFT_461605 [Astrocystis sublimbata]